MKYLPYIFIFLLAISSCSDTSNTDPKFVIEGFLFAGEPVRDIKIKEQISIRLPDSLEQIVTDAQVILIKNEQEYPLQFNNGKYHYLGNDLQVESGDEFKIEVTVGDRTASAVTIVPVVTSGLSISDTLIKIPTLRLDFALQETLNELFFSARITARWDNSRDELHFISIEHTDAEIDSLFPTGIPQGVLDFLASFKFANEALEVDSFNIIGIAFESYGRHKVKVYRGNQEYADLFNNPEQDSRDLTSPPTNIDNGFGIFSAFAADSVYFDIVR